MLDLIDLFALLAAVAVCIWVPIETRKVRGGWTRRRFEGTHAEFIVKYRRELTMIVWTGLIVGLINLALAFATAGDSRQVVKIVSGVVWLAAGAITWVARRQLDESVPV